MVRVYVASVLAAMVTLVTSSRAQYNPAQQQQQQQQQPSGKGGVTPNNWYIAAEAPAYNNQVVSEVLGNLRRVRAPREAYGAFDWDNTCTFGDISYTSMFYQVDNLQYRIPPAQFAEAFALGYNATNGDACLPKGIGSVLGKDVGGKDVLLKDILEDTAKDYKVLYDLYIGPKFVNNGTASPLEAVKETAAYKNFRAKLGFLAFGVEASYGTQEFLPCAQKIGMTIFPQLLVGMTDAEMRSLIRSSLRWNLAAKLDTPAYTSTDGVQVMGSYMTGLRVFNGQETVMRALRAVGADVYIISASPQQFVEEVAALAGLTYLVPKSNVFGVRFKFDKDGKFTGKLVEDYPITWGPGKAEIVKKYLMPKHNGKAPIFASGDSNGDCAFMEMVRDGIVHVNNRLKDNTNCIQGFYEKACANYNGVEKATGNRYLLQGQDKEIGSWINSGFTTKDGVKYTSGATANSGCEVYKFLQA